MSPQPGLYTIHPKDRSEEGLLVGPVPRMFPPPDVPVKVGGGPLIERFHLKADEGNTFTVFAGGGRPNDYKWIVREEESFLFVSSTAPPQPFRFESSGDNVWVIGLPNQDLILTLNREAEPALSFKPADGSPAQCFELIRIDRA